MTILMIFWDLIWMIALGPVLIVAFAVGVLTGFGIHGAAMVTIIVILVLAALLSAFNYWQDHH